MADKALDKSMKLKNIDKEAVKEKAIKIATPKFGKIESGEDFKNRALTFLFYAGGALATWKFLINPMWKKHKLNNANKKVISDPNTQLASLLRQAIIGAGTDEKLVMEVAQKITDWTGVEKAYKSLTNGNNLNQDLYGDLSSAEYKQFMDIINHNRKARKSKSKKGYLVVSKKAVRLRSTPDSSISAWSFNSNILDTVEARKFLGFATGVYKTDSRGVLYYQVRINYTAGIPKHHKDTYDELKSRILTFWVGAGAIDMFKYFSQMRTAYPNAIVYKGTKDTGLRKGFK